MNKMMTVVNEMVMSLGVKYNFSGEEAVRWLENGGVLSSMSPEKLKLTPVLKVKEKKVREKKLKVNVSEVEVDKVEVDKVEVEVKKEKVEVKKEKVEKEKVVKEKVEKEKVVKEKVKAVKEEKFPYPLPFNGKNNMEFCQGIRINQGLYTQCENKKGEKVYCTRCEKETDKSGKPEGGTMEERMNVGILDYKDEKGRTPQNYLKVLERLKIERTQVEEELLKRGMEAINEIHWEKKEVKRGRKPTNTEKEEKEEKKKGRPKKEKKEVEVEVEDLFANLVAKVKEESESQSEKEEGEEEEETIEVKRFEHKGLKYLKSSTGVIYDLEQEEVGKWDEVKQEIIFFDLKEEEEEEYEE
jgi:hypothetical protein